MRFEKRPEANPDQVQRDPKKLKSFQALAEKESRRMEAREPLLTGEAVKVMKDGPVILEFQEALAFMVPRMLTRLKDLRDQARHEETLNEARYQVIAMRAERMVPRLPRVKTPCGQPEPIGVVAMWLIPPKKEEMNPSNEWHRKALCLYMRRRVSAGLTSKASSRNTAASWSAIPSSDGTRNPGAC